MNAAATSSFPILLEKLRPRPDDFPEYDLYQGTYEQGKTPRQDSIRCGGCLEECIADETSVTWTPSGDAAFLEVDTNDAADKSGSLYVKKLPDGEPERIVGDSVRSVAYAPLRDEMAFVAWSSKRERFGLWLASQDGSHARPVNLGKLEPSEVAYSPDGGSLVFSCLGGQEPYDPYAEAPNGLCLLDMGTGNVRRLTRAVDWTPSFSPDGKTIVFERWERPYRSIDTLDVASGQVRMVQGSQDYSVMHPTFSPDGSRIIYARAWRHPRETRGLPELWVVPSSGGPAHRLTMKGFAQMAVHVRAGEHPGPEPSSGNAGQGDRLNR